MTDGGIELFEMYNFYLYIIAVDLRLSKHETDTIITVNIIGSSIAHL